MARWQSASGPAPGLAKGARIDRQVSSHLLDWSGSRQSTYWSGATAKSAGSFTPVAWLGL